MSTLLPIQTSSRARVNSVPASPPERRPTDGSTDAFADSLATARGDETRVSLDESAAAKSRLAAQQRAQLQVLMLSGAMKFAVTRGDAPNTATLPGTAFSLPATPPSDEATAVQLADGVITVSPIARPESPNAPSLSVFSAPMLQTVSGAPATLFDRGGVQSLPATPPSGETDVDDESASKSENTFVKSELSSISGATIAALQLVSVLPIDTLIMSLPATPEDGFNQGEEMSNTSGRSPDNLARSLPATPDMQLVEDHFDAPSAAINATPAKADGTVAATANGNRTSIAIAAATRTSRQTGAVQVAATDVETDLARLAPEFRERLERVIDRMRQEFGRSVTVVETVRSQARQNALYEQGRTAEGPVVTWTRNSRHSQGLAADLLVDGQWHNPLGYAQLAAVAKQEGLRTLGARDPGHVELPGEGSVSGETLGALLGDLQGEAGDQARQMRADVNGERDHRSRGETMAQVANVAQVARIANVAAVSRVAAVARPGDTSQGTTSGSDAISPTPVSSVLPTPESADLSGAVRTEAPTSTVNMADRISRLMDLQATQAARPLNSVLLRMDNVSGIEDQIRIDTRGTSVDARLGLGNAQQAAALTDRLGELRDALERRGLSADGVRVQAASQNRGIDSVNFSRMTAPTLELAAMRAASDSNAQGNNREQRTSDQQQREAFAREQARHTPRSSADDARQRSRREQPEDRR